MVLYQTHRKTLLHPSLIRHHHLQIPDLPFLQRIQLESVRDRNGNTAYLDRDGMFGPELFLYTTNGEYIGFLTDHEDDYPRLLGFGRR
jgi:hypothetical protein